LRIIAVLLRATRPQIASLESTFKTAGWEPRTVRSEEALVAGGKRNPQGDVARETLDGQRHRHSVILLPMASDGSNGGAQIIRSLRRNRIRTPILLIAPSLDGTESQIALAAALRAGADDFLIGAVTEAELSLRLTAIVERKRRQSAVGLIKIGDLEVDRLSRVLKRQGRSVALTECEYRTFQCLARRAEKPVPRSVILRRLRRSAHATTSNLVDVYILYLRRKLNRIDSHCTVQTMRGIGYMLTVNTGSDEITTEQPRRYSLT
jgi:two-component system OmpR family response regulator